LGAIFEPVFDPILSPQKYFGTPGAPMVRQFVVHMFGSFFTRFLDQI
jgi:hypothetical protein